MPTVHVNLGPRSYDIEIGSGNLREAAKFCDAEQDDAHAVVITDSNVDELYSEPVSDALQESAAQIDVLIVEAGEQSKAPEVATDLWEQLLDQGADRKTCRRGARRRRGGRPGRVRGGHVRPRAAIRADSDDAARAGR